jgi:hypothetical protein
VQRPGEPEVPGGGVRVDPDQPGSLPGAHPLGHVAGDRDRGGGREADVEQGVPFRSENRAVPVEHRGNRRAFPGPYRMVTGSRRANASNPL